MTTTRENLIFGQTTIVKNYAGETRAARVIGTSSDGVVILRWFDTGAIGCLSVGDTILD